MAQNNNTCAIKFVNLINNRVQTAQIYCSEPSVKTTNTIMAEMILGMHPANERRCYFVTTSHIGWAQT